MPNFAPVTINDGVNDLVMKPTRMDGTKGYLTAGIPDTAYFHQLTLDAPAYARGGVQSPQVKLVTPVLRTVNAELKSAGNVTSTFSLNAIRGSEAEREQAIDALINALQNAEIRKILISGEGLW